MTNTALLLDDDRLSTEVLDEILHQPAHALDGAAPPKVPGVYVLTYTGPLPLYERLRSTGYPLYAGKSDDLADRMSRHRRNLAKVADIDPAHLEVRSLRTTKAQAPYFEALLQAALDPLWNQLWLSGFGSRFPGLQRITGRTPAWCVLHPGRHVGTGQPKVSRATLERQAAEHLRAHVPRYRIWPT